MRRFGIEARKVIGRVEGRTEMRIQLPVGWKVRLPRTVKADSPFGSYASTYVQDGREFRLTRTVTGKTGLYAKDRIGELVAWMREMGSDDAKFVVIERGAK